MNSLITRGGLFDDFFRDLSPGFLVRPLHGDALPQSIKVDVKESGDGYTVLADIPGVSKEDIHVHIEGSTVTVSAEVKQEDKQTSDEKMLRSELPKKASQSSQRLRVD